MKGEFEARVVFEKIALSRASIHALRHLERFDAILFTSNYARASFEKEIRRRHVAPPRCRSIQVGPRGDLLRFDFKGKRLLFPRSELAPVDIVRALRARGAVVRTMPLYTAKGAILTRAQRKDLLDGTIKRLYLKSPSGAHGLLRQFRGHERTVVLDIPARCIGETTAAAARNAGFKKVFIR